MLLSEMITDARRELNQPNNTGMISDYELAAYANHAQDLVATKIIEADMNFFEQSDQTLGFIQNQEEYTLPARLWDRKITRVTRTDLAQPKQLYRIRFQEKEQYHSANVFLSGSDADGDVYYLRNNAIGLKPTPKSTIATNILIHYVQLPWEMIWAMVDYVDPTHFNLPVVTTGGTNVIAGRLQSTPNYYTGARFRLMGTNADSSTVLRGFEATITNWNVSTRKATIDTQFPGNPTQMQFCILSAIPVEYHEIMYQFMILKGALKIKSASRYQSAKANLETLWDNLINTIEPRAYDENQHVRPPIDQHFD